MAFHNVPPNGFPDIPDIEDLEAVQGDIAALKTGKAPKTDIAANFSATANYAVGDLVYKDGVLYECINAHEAASWAAGDFTAASVGSAISGVNSNLTGLDVALSVPDNAGKNLIPMTIDGIKALNTTGTWDSNTYTLNDVTFAFTVSNGLVTSIAVNGSNSSVSQFFVLLGSVTLANGVAYKVNGISGGSDLTYRLNVQGIDNYKDGDNNLLGDGNTHNVRLSIMGSAVVDFTTAPMIRLATVTDATFAPYIPSVETRLEAVEVVKHRKIAESATSGTYADKLNSLYSAYNALTALEQHHSYIVFSANIVPLMDVSNTIFASSMKYTTGSTAFNGYSAKLASTGSTMHKIVASGSGNTISELSSTSNSDVFYLYV